MANTDSETNDSKNDEKTAVLELLTAGIGLVMVIAALGVLLYDAATKKDTPPILIVKTDAIIAIEAGYLVKFSLYNKGSENAADVLIEGKIADGGATETSSVTIDYSPSNSKRSGGLIFTKKPESSNFQIRATGYNEP